MTAHIVNVQSDRPMPDAKCQYKISYRKVPQATPMEFLDGSWALDITYKDGHACLRMDD